MRIPRTIEAAVSQLESIGQLVTAKEWERAAIVATWVRKGSGGPKLSTPGQLLTCREFADLGAHGLTSPTTVARYLEAWEAQELDYPTPGQTIHLPAIPFPGKPKEQLTRTGKEAAQVIRERGPAAVVQHLTNDEAMALAEALPSAGRSVAETQEWVAEERRSDPGHFIHINGLLAKMHLLGERVLEEVRLSAILDRNQLDLLNHRVSQLSGLVQLLTLAVTDSSDVDWDAELAALKG